jgi:hypothetical protein
MDDVAFVVGEAQTSLLLVVFVNRSQTTCTSVSNVLTGACIVRDAVRQKGIHGVARLEQGCSEAWSDLEVLRNRLFVT